jgi:hypothetical protein
LDDRGKEKPGKFGRCEVSLTWRPLNKRREMCSPGLKQHGLELDQDGQKQRQIRIASRQAIGSSKRGNRGEAYRDGRAWSMEMRGTGGGARGERSS